MVNLPISVIAYLTSFMWKERSLAYLLVNKEGSLSDWGGNLAIYGVNNLRQGESAKQQVFFLEGLLPLNDYPLFLPYLNIEDGICADVHIFSTDEGDWVILLDASWDAICTNSFQQQINDYSLKKNN